MRTEEIVETPAGGCRVELEGGRIVRVHLGARGVASRRTGPGRRWVEAWFRGEDTSGAPLGDQGSTPLQRKIYAVVRAIPRGETRTYGEVARAAGRPGAARAVGTAMGRNRYPLFVP